jgi:Tol biopolymer transport system component
MRSVRSKLAVSVPVVLAVLADGRVVAHDRPGERTLLVSRTAEGELGNGVSSFPTISGDGRFVAFQSTATNLSPLATDGTQQIYLLDRTTGAIELVSRNADSEAGNEESSGAAISFNGRFVTFRSNAENLVPGDTNEQRDVFVFDRSTGQVERVSVSSTGDEGTGIDDSEELEEHSGLQALEGHPPSISGDGRYVVFWTGLNGLVSSDYDDVIDVFVRDRWLHTTRRISEGLGGAPADGSSRRANISAAGNLIVFDSEASNLVADDTNGKIDIFAYDVVRGRLRKVTRGFDGGPTSDDSLEPYVDFAGRIIAFTSWADNLIAGDANGTRDAFVVDRRSSEVKLVSVAPDGSQLPAPTFEAGPSPDGRYVATMTLASLVPQVTANIFLYDLRTGRREQLNVNSEGQPGDPLIIGSILEPIADPSVPAMTPKAASVVFWTTAANLVDHDTNEVGDVFIRERRTGRGSHHRSDND